MEPSLSEKVFQTVITWMLKKHFAHIFVRYSEEINVSIPTLYVTNHANWWDLLLAIWINRHYLRQDAHLLVNEQESKALAWLKQEGLIPFNIDLYEHIQEALDYGAEILDGRFGSLWVLGQGEVKHQDFRPLRFLPGIGSLFEKVNYIQVVPVAFYYSFTGPYPSAYIHLTRPVIPSTFEKGNRRTWVAACEKELVYQLDELKENVIAGDVKDFECALTGRTFLGKQWQSLYELKRNTEYWIQKIKKG